MRKFGKNVGGCRRNDQRIRALRSVDVFDGRSRIARVGAFRRPQAGNDFVSGKSGESEWLDEVLRRLGHHHVNVERLLLQIAHQFRRFVCSDAARNPDRDLHEPILRCGQEHHYLKNEADSYGANFGISGASISGFTTGTSSVLT